MFEIFKKTDYKKENENLTALVDDLTLRLEESYCREQEQKALYNCMAFENEQKIADLKATIEELENAVSSLKRTPQRKKKIRYDERNILS